MSQDHYIGMKLHSDQIEKSNKSDCNYDVSNVECDERQITNLTQKNTMYLGRYKKLIPVLYSADQIPFQN
jgi:hypothetical protein